VKAGGGDGGEMVSGGINGNVNGVNPPKWRNQTSGVAASAAAKTLINIEAS
jgi:hypothetical protein